MTAVALRIFVKNVEMVSSRVKITKEVLEGIFINSDLFILDFHVTSEKT